MITVSATEFSESFGYYRELVQREAVAVTSHKRVMGYFVSSVEYDEYMRLKSRMPKVYAVQDLPATTLQAIADSKMDERHNHLNALLDE